MILNRDEDVSRRGYVAVIYSMCHSYRNQEDQAKELFDITQWNMQRTALPERIVACHWCYESPQAAIDVQIGRVLMGRKYRLRTRTFCCNGGDGGGNDKGKTQNIGSDTDCACKTFVEGRDFERSPEQQDKGAYAEECEEHAWQLDRKAAQRNRVKQ